MAFTTIPSSGAKLRASVLEALVTEVRPVPAVKAGDTSRNTTTTHTADPDLSVTLPPGTWRVEFDGTLTSAANAAGDFSYRWAYPSDATMSEGVHGVVDTLASGQVATDMNVAGSSADATSPSAAKNIGASTSVTYFLAVAIVTIVTTGAVVIEWAQASSNANNTTLKAGSTLTATRLS